VKVYRTAVAVFSALFVVIGLALIARTAAEGGGAVGFILGALFTALGTARLWSLRRGGP
jgi:hypothetical protein